MGVEALSLYAGGLSHGGIPSLSARGTRQQAEPPGDCSSPIRGLEDPSAPFPHPLAPPPPAPSSPARQPHAGRTARDCQRRSRSSSSSPGLLRKGGGGWLLRLAPRGARLNSSRRQRSWPLQRGGKRASQLQPRPASPLFRKPVDFFLFSPVSPSAAFLALLQTKDEAAESKAGVVCPGDLVDRRSPSLSRGQEEVGSGGTRRAADAKGT